MGIFIFQTAGTYRSQEGEGVRCNIESRGRVVMTHVRVLIYL